MSHRIDVIENLMKIMDYVFFQIHFKDNVTQLKRVLKTLQQIQSSPSATINDIKTAVLPLLKGNLHLTQCFLQLFLDDPPPPR